MKTSRRVPLELPPPLYHRLYALWQQQRPAAEARGDTSISSFNAYLRRILLQHCDDNWADVIYQENGATQ